MGKKHYFVVLKDIYSLAYEPKLVLKKDQRIVSQYFFENRDYYIVPTEVFTPIFKGYIFRKDSVRHTIEK